MIESEKTGADDPNWDSLSGSGRSIYSYWAFIGNKAFYKGPNKCYTSPMPGSQMTGWHLAGVNLSFYNVFLSVEWW